MLPWYNDAMGLQVKYFQHKDWLEYDAIWKENKWSPYTPKIESYILAGIYEFNEDVNSEQCMWDLCTKVFNVNEWHLNPGIRAINFSLCRHVQKSDVFTLVGYSSYIFGTEMSYDSLGSIYPFKAFHDPDFE